jgi:2-oxoisovalerate dehydrogenase E1 component
LKILECDGTDIVESWETMREAVEYARARKGPAFVHAHVTRPYSHSLSDDERAYKTEAMRAEEARRDPVIRTASLLREQYEVSQEELDEVEREVRAVINLAVDEALESPQPNPSTAMHYLYSPDVERWST